MLCSKFVYLCCKSFDLEVGSGLTASATFINLELVNLLILPLACLVLFLNDSICARARCPIPQGAGSKTTGIEIFSFVPIYSSLAERGQHSTFPQWHETLRTARSNFESVERRFPIHLFHCP
jgi:hypothetical protein